jgi:hypothetical protein
MDMRIVVLCIFLVTTSVVSAASYLTRCDRQINIFVTMDGCHVGHSNWRLLGPRCSPLRVFSSTLRYAYLNFLLLLSPVFLSHFVRSSHFRFMRETSIK